MDDSVAARLDCVRRRIAAAEADCARAPGSVRLVVASKTADAALIADAADAGQRDFGESYLQEAKRKIEALRSRSLCWHFIGAIQSNKTRDIAALFDWAHGVDRLSVARRLNDRRREDQGALNVCLQVNLDREPGKAGAAPEEAVALAEQIAALPRLALRGLMAIPAPTGEVAAQRRAFARLRALFDAAARRCDGLDTLSMGMSGDFEAAIAEGATLVRIGAAILGPRPVISGRPRAAGFQPTAGRGRAV